MAKADRVSDKNKPSSSARHSSPNASDGATWALIKAWAEKYEQCDRRNLNEEDWQEIAVAVNSHDHPNDGGSKKRWTVERCKNRLRNVKTRYKKEKATEYSSWVFFERLDELLGPASYAEELWELDKAVRKTTEPVAELAQKLRGFEAQMKELTGMESDELVQALARLQQAWSGFAASVADAGSKRSEERILDQTTGPFTKNGAAVFKAEQPNQTAVRGSLKIRISLRPRPRP